MADTPILTPNEHRLSQDRYEEFAAIGVLPRWVDAHSVTCALCGDLADERETIGLWVEDYVDPELRATINGYPDGEAHQSCFEAAEYGEKPSSAQD